MSMVHTFAGNPLDRGEVQRRDEDWVRATLLLPETRVLALWRLRVPVQGEGEGMTLAWHNSATCAAIDGCPEPVFLGLIGAVAHYALDISHVEDPVATLALADTRFEEPRAAAMVLRTDEAGILAQAKAQVDWHRRHRFCGVCGDGTVPRRGGQVRNCPGCGADHFPRTDPVAIMLIVDGDRCLLGQPNGPLVKMRLYSALAGFIDQGESIEEAVRREVREEAGIEVGAVRYHSSQPWPFPSSLMIGCHGVAASTDIVWDTHEMNEVRWFERAEVETAMAGNNPDLRLPGGIAIAHHLIRAWIEGEVEL